MYNSNVKASLLTTILAISGCATSMTPSQFNEHFPQATTSKFYTKTASNEAIKNEECRLLVENRKYTSPIGLTINGDVKNGAIGIDEWVQTDKGNSYTINNFEWISVGNEGTTQLIVYFNTLQCK